jgi:hypothetical protein
MGGGRLCSRWAAVSWFVPYGSEPAIVETRSSGTEIALRTEHLQIQCEIRMRAGAAEEHLPGGWHF